MTQATSRGMFSGGGVGLISSTAGLESIMPVSTSTRPAGWSIVQTNTGNCSPSAIRSAARWALIAGTTASTPGDSLIGALLVRAVTLVCIGVLKVPPYTSSDSLQFPNSSVFGGEEELLGVHLRGQRSQLGSVLGD